MLVGRLLLIGGLLLIALALILSVAEQEFDETAAHTGALGVSRAHRRGRWREPVGVDHGGFGRWSSLDRGGLMKSGAERRCAGEERKRDFFEHRRTLYCFVLLKLFVGERPIEAPLHATN